MEHLLLMFVCLNFTISSNFSLIIITIFIFFLNFITKNIGSGGSAGSTGSAVCSSAD